MKIRDFAFLADENIHPEVVAFLRNEGHDVLYAREGHVGASDTELLKLALSQNRVVITHDKDFGALTIARREPMIGVVFLRPGHINPHFTRDTLEVLFQANLDAVPPFIVVAKRKENTITIRLRNP